MNREDMNHEDGLRQAVRHELGRAPLPAQAQAKLEEAYSLLESIPQESSKTAPVARPSVSHAKPTAAKHVMKKGMVIAVAAALVGLFGGTAFAVSRLVEMQAGDAPFFQSGSNLPIYDSLQAGVSSLSAAVGDTVEVEGVKVTLDTVSCDRNIVNLFFTLEKEGGFDLNEQSNYEGSQENEWSRLQRLAPGFGYTLTSAGETLGGGTVNQLDAYIEDGRVKCMQRIVPDAALPDQVDIKLEGWASWGAASEDGRSTFTMETGMDLSTVAQPRELGAQDLTFPTSQGDKTMGIMRFTASELGTVMVVRNDNVMTGDMMSEGSSYGPPDNVLSLHALKITDDQGNVLTPVGAGDGSGTSIDAKTQVIEYANLSPDAQSVTFTPMLTTVDWDSLSVDERKALNESNQQHVDVSQIGAKLPTSEYGGYELTDWNVADGTVSISLKPYGWQANGTYMELVSEQEVTFLASEFTNPDGTSGTGYHSGIMYRKHDYLTGNFVQMVSYYAAGDDELRGLTQYGYLSSFGSYTEETNASLLLPLVAS